MLKKKIVETQRVYVQKVQTDKTNSYAPEEDEKIKNPSHFGTTDVALREYIRSSEKSYRADVRTKDKHDSAKKIYGFQ